MPRWMSGGLGVQQPLRKVQTSHKEAHEAEPVARFGRLSSIRGGESEYYDRLGNQQCAQQVIGPAREALRER